MRKRPHCHLCRVMEMLCRRSLSHVTDLPTSMHHTHSSTDLVTKHLWAPREHKNQHKYDLTKATCVEHWTQAFGLHASAWVAADEAEMGSKSGASTKWLSPFMPISPGLQLGRTWDLTWTPLGFLGFLPVPLASNAAWYRPLKDYCYQCWCPMRGILKVTPKSRLLW